MIPSQGRNTPVISGDTFHGRRYCFKSNANDRRLRSGRRGIADQLDDPYDHDRCDIQLDCNERFRGLCLSRIADCKRQRLLQPNLSDNFVKLGDFVIVNT
jgi:hypothetical protein